METDSHKRLSLHLVELGPGENWEGQGGTISFVFPRTGNGKVKSEAANGSLSPGDVLVLNCKSGIHLVTESKRGMAFWTFFLTLEDLFPLFTCQEILYLPTVRASLGSWKYFPADCRPAIDAHKLLAEVTPQFHLSHRSQLLGAAAAILDEEFRLAWRPRDGSSRVEEHTLAVLESLSLEQMLDLPIGELAAKFGCSRRHLNRTFNHQFGMSVAAVRLELRLLKAAALLRNPQAKVINVGLECGFNHSGLFNLCFKRRFDCTPGKWREQNSADLSPDLASAPVECTLRRVGLCPLPANFEPNVGKAKASHALVPGAMASAFAGAGSISAPNSLRPGATRLAKGANGL